MRRSGGNLSLSKSSEPRALLSDLQRKVQLRRLVSHPAPPVVLQRPQLLQQVGDVREGTVGEVVRQQKIAFRFVAGAQEE